MASLSDIDIMLLVKDGHGRIFLHGKRGFCKYKVQSGHCPLVFSDFMDMLAGFSA